MILVEAKKDRIGGILIRPVNKEYAERFARAAELNGAGIDEDHWAYIQDGEAFKENSVPKRYHRDIQHGWDVRWRADPWEVGHYYGWDAHVIAENGNLWVPHTKW